MFGFIVWIVSSFYCLFNPSDSFGKKVIFCSWILGPFELFCNLLFKSSLPILGMFAGIPIIGTIGAMVVAYKFGEQIIDRLNPNASRVMYILIGLASSVILPYIVDAIFPLYIIK